MQPPTNTKHIEEFCIYTSSGKLLGIKTRNEVHHHGDWHRAVQLNLFHKGKLLIQQRSNIVDIGKGQFDQSLATQLLVKDRENDLFALQRGLLEELQIPINTLNIRRVAGPKKIIKKYEYDKSLYNREFVTLYEAHIQEKILHTKNPKVSKLFWMSIDEIKKIASKHPEKFTKTFYMWITEVL